MCGRTASDDDGAGWCGEIAFAEDEGRGAAVGARPVHPQVIVEVRLSRDAAKVEAWPMYLTATKALHHCQSYLLVIAGDTGLARWCARKIETGQSGFDPEPTVVGPAELPPFTDPELARRCPEQAVLSVYLHRGSEAAVELAEAARSAR